MPLITKARKALLAGEQFLHGALFEVALLGEELLQGFDEGIRIAQGVWLFWNDAELEKNQHIIAFDA
jgi:hypothetical protein